jgi:hypothetical protein
VNEDLVDTNQATPEPSSQRFAEHVAALLREGPPLEASPVVRAEAVQSWQYQWHVVMVLEDGSRWVAENLHCYREPSG